MTLTLRNNARILHYVFCAAVACGFALSSDDVSARLASDQSIESFTSDAASTDQTQSFVRIAQRRATRINRYTTPLRKAKGGGWDFRRARPCRACGSSRAGDMTPNWSRKGRMRRR